MAKNNVFVQGNYVDVHDNEVVNLNIDKATLSLSEKRSNEAKDLITLSLSEKQSEDSEQQAAEVLTSNDAFLKIMDQAVALGLCTREGWQYRWKVKAEAAYFAAQASHFLNLSNRHDQDGELAISWKPFEALFGLQGLRLTFNDINQCKTKVKYKGEIDKLFR